MKKYITMSPLIIFIFAGITLIITVNCDCNIVDGRTIRHGRKFTFANQPCVDYLCESDKYFEKEAKCKHNDECIKQGRRIKKDGCVVFECAETTTGFGKQIGFVRREVECEFEGTCYPDGDKIVKNGENCKCRADDDTANIECP